MTDDQKSRDKAFTSACAALKASVAGAVFTPDEAGFGAARTVWNAMIDRSPAVIIRPKGVADIMAAVAFARDHALGVSVRGGGHNVAGHAVGAGSVMIDLSNMRSVRVDPTQRRGWVEGGALWGDVDRETQAFGLATPGGLISDTGVGGLTLSGGIGWLRSRHGLSIDNLVAADVVTGAGQLVHASRNENADLLWALKGGGGNFGVVTNFEFALHPAGPEMMFCAPAYPIERAGQAIRFWRDFLRDKNGDIGSLAEFSTIKESPDVPKDVWGQRVVTLAAVYAGDASEGEKIMQPLRELDPVIDYSRRMTYCVLQKLFDDALPAGKFRCYWKCHYLGGLSDDVIDLIVDANRMPPSAYTLSSIWNFGGATAAVPAADTALGDRSMPYMFSIDTSWLAREDDALNIDWTRVLWNRLQPHSQGGRLYLNFPGLGEEGDELVRRSYGPNYARLRAIKKTYDPDNLFRFNQNIRPG